MRKTLLVAVAAALPLAAHAQETTLKLVSAFGETTTYVKHMTPWIQKFNAEGKGIAQINFIGGPKAIPTFEVGIGEERGGRDGNEHGRVLHEPHARSRFPQAHADHSRRAAQERRFQLHQQGVEQKANMVYLARMVDETPFHLYLTKKIDKPDLTGLQLRITRCTAISSPRWARA